MKSLRVLIVDDSADSAEMLAMQVRLIGHETAVAYDAHGALDSAQAFRPDVVFLDIGLPEIDGYELARRLRQLPGFERTHLVATTGYSGSDDRQLGREAGLDEYLVKPIDFAEIERLFETIAG